MSKAQVASKLLLVELEDGSEWGGAEADLGPHLSYINPSWSYPTLGLTFYVRSVSVTDGLLLAA